VPGRLGGSHRALAAGGGVAEPALGARRQGPAPGRPCPTSPIVTVKSVPLRDRRRRRDDELEVVAREVLVGGLGVDRRARGRVRVGRVDQHQQAGPIQRIGIVLALRIAPGRSAGRT